MRHVPLIVTAATGLTLAAASLASANTSASSSAAIVSQQQMSASKLAQAQENTKQKGQGYYKQDTTKRKSWGGG